MKNRDWGSKVCEIIVVTTICLAILHNCSGVL